MATVNGMTAEAMIAIRDGVVVSGAVNLDGNLILTKYDGSTINAGSVKGPPGEDAAPGSVAIVGDTTVIRTSDGRIKIASPTQAEDGATKGYVDNKVNIIEIGSNVDLNTLILSGKYFQSESAEATLLLNYPTPEGGLLEIFDNGAQQIVQRYTVTGDSTATPKDFNGGEVYIRIHHWWAGWRDWHKLGYRSQELVSGTNLNDIRTAGTYMQTESAEAIAGLNYPIVGAGGLLEVFTNNDGSRVNQRFTPNGFGGERFYQRVYYIGTWYTWQRYSPYTPVADPGLPVEIRRGSWNVPLVVANSGGGGGAITFSPAFASSDNIHISVMLHSARLTWSQNGITASGFTLSIDNHSNANSNAGTAYWKAERYV